MYVQRSGKRQLKLKSYPKLFVVVSLQDVASRIGETVVEGRQECGEGIEWKDNQDPDCQLELS